MRVIARSIATAVSLAWRAGKGRLVAFAGVELVGGLVPVLSAWLVKLALDRLATDPTGTQIVVLAVGFAATAFVTAVTVPLHRYLQASSGRRTAMHAKARLYAAMARVQMLSTIETPSFRDRLRLAEQASQNGPGQVVESALGGVRTVVTLTGMLATVAYIEPWLAVVLIVAAGPALVAELQLSRGRMTLLWRISPAERREMFFTELITSLSAAKETRLFGAHRLFHRRMLAELTSSNVARDRYDRRELRVQSLLAVVSATFTGGALGWSLLAAAGGRLTLGDVAAVVLVVGGALSSLASLVGHVAAGHHAALLLAEYRELVDDPAADDPRAAADPDTATAVARARTASAVAGPDTAAAGGFRGIELIDVWFRYDDRQPWVLRGVTLTIAEGEAVALVGRNGSGKSTLVKLLCRFYDPTRGSIRWNGVDLRDLPFDELRRRIGAVFQDFMCYELTARENIALGDVDGRDEFDLTRERITEAATRADMLGVLDALPQGPDTMLSRTFVDYETAGENGVLLSGGQWQRLALARALLRGRRDLLILDEPSSGLDAAAEHRIHRGLAERRDGCTSILISHRLNTVRDADAIVVLDGGRLTERGTHSALLAAGGTYAELFRLQAEGYEVEEVRTA